MRKKIISFHLIYLTIVLFLACQFTQAQQGLAKDAAEDMGKVEGIVEDAGNPLGPLCNNISPSNKSNFENQSVYINDFLSNPHLWACEQKRNRLSKKKESVSKCIIRAQDNFTKSIEPIKKAAKIFDINPKHLACLLLEESQFLENAVSGRGPMGFAQYSEGTVDNMRNKLGRINFLNCLKKPDPTKKKIKCNQIKSGRRRRICKNNLKVCRAKKDLLKKQAELLPKWEEYIKSAQSNDTHPHAQKLGTLTKNDAKDLKEYPYIFCSYPQTDDLRETCGKLKNRKQRNACLKKPGQDACRKNIHWSIGAAALYIKEIQDYYLNNHSINTEIEKLNGNIDEKEKEVLKEKLEIYKKEFFLMAAGLYNPGPGIGKHIIPKKMSPKGIFKKKRENWEKHILNKKYNEPKNYIIKIRKCIEGYHKAVKK